MRQKLMLAVAAGVGSVGLFGAAALGAFGADASTAVVSAIAPAASAVMGEDKGGDRLKQLLDGLVQKGVITQQQEDAILAAAKDTTTAKVRTAKVVRDLQGGSGRCPVDCGQCGHHQGADGQEDHRCAGQDPA